MIACDWHLCSVEIVVGCGVDAKSCEQWMVWVGERHEVGGAVDGAAGANFPTVVFEECLEAEADAEDRDGAYRRPDEVHHAAGFAGGDQVLGRDK